MFGKSDQRIIELKLLENLAEGTWRDGVCTTVGAGQTTALGLSEYIYADMLVTLYEDGYLKLTEGQIISKIDNSERVKTRAIRNEAVSWLSVSPHFHYASITYRGLRRIDELRDQLRRDRILEKFGILLDGRYITSDLIYFLEKADGEPVSVLLGDVDDFKRFNSDYGYKAGDAVLQQVFQIVRCAVRDRGEVYRRGGEEIVALLPYSGLDASKDLAKRICEEVAKTFVLYDDQNLHATLSIGLAASPPSDPDGPRLETYAEKALNEAKNHGKNCVWVWEGADHE
jgi:diguanylate cyclase (GGDEF)-like protein